MKITVSVIKADVGGIGGHTKPSDGLIEAVAKHPCFLAEIPSYFDVSNIQLIVVDGKQEFKNSYRHQNLVHCTILPRCPVMSSK